jgi:hypothetical protein
VRAGTASFFLAIGAARLATFPTTGAARLTNDFVERAARGRDALRAVTTFFAAFLRADAVVFADALLAAFFLAGAVFFLADAAFPTDRVRPTLRRVVAVFRPAAFRLAAFRLAALRLAMSVPFCVPPGRLKAAPYEKPWTARRWPPRQDRVRAYLDSGPISDVKSNAYRRRTIPCRGSGCDPRPPSRVRPQTMGRCPPRILHRRYSRGGPVPATFRRCSRLA